VHDVRLLEDYVTAASADTRFAFVVLGVFAFVAVLLAGIGVYGVVAYATACRTREIAVRMALGAAPRSIVSLVIRDGLAWTAVGVVAGIGGALVLSRYLGALLFRVGERDPLTFITVAVLLGGSILATMGLTALKAVRIDPMLALRAE
jgi:putative ABC transport system permease protein